MKTLLIRTVKLSIILSCLIYLSCSKDEAEQILDVDQTILTFQPGAETKSFNITTSGEWLITADGLEPYYGSNFARADWCEISPVAGKGNAQIIITTTNESKDNNMVLHIEYGKKEKTVTLIQN